MNSINSASLTQNIGVNLGAVSGTTVKITATVGNVNNAAGNTVEMKFNGTTVKRFLTWARAPLSYTLIDAKTATVTAPAPSGSGVSTLQFKYYYNGTGAAYVDFARFNYRRQPGISLVASWAFRGLRNQRTCLRVQNASYSCKVPVPVCTVWDITDPLTPISLQGNLSGSTYTFTRAGNSLKEFISFDGSAIRHAGCSSQQSYCQPRPAWPASN